MYQQPFYHHHHITSSASHGTLRPHCSTFVGPHPPQPQPQAQLHQDIKQQFDITSIQEPDPSVLKDAGVLKPSQMIPSLPELSDISSVQLPKEPEIIQNNQEQHHQNMMKKNVDQEEEQNTTRDTISPIYSPVPPEVSPQKDNLVAKEKEVISNQLSDFDLLKAEISPKKPVVVTKVEKVDEPKNISSKVLEKVPEEPKEDQKVVDESNVTEEPSTTATTTDNILAEDQLDTSTEDLPRRRGRSSQATSDTAPTSAKPRNTRGSSGSPVKNSPDENPKKRRGRPKRTPEPSTSEDSSQEKEKENSASSAASATSKSDENKKQKLLKQKGGNI